MLRKLSTSLALLAVVMAATAQVTTETVNRGTHDLYQGTARLSQNATEAECLTAASAAASAARATNTATPLVQRYGCRTITEVLFSTVAAPPAPPPPPPDSTGPAVYLSDCQPGAAAGCVPGDNANAGTSPSAPKRTLVGLDVNALPAGARVLFVRGGAWAGFNVQLQNPNATPEAPLVFDAYGTGPAPLLRAGGTFYAFQFGRFNDLTLDGGYTFRNLRLDGSASTGSWGFHLRNQVRNVTIESNEITGFALGIHMGNAGERGNAGIVIRNNVISRNSQMGILGDAHDLLVEGNTFEGNNFTGSTFEHAIYLGGRGTNGVVRNNRFINNSVVNGVCTGGNFTVHGQWDGLLIEGNTITQVDSDGGCYGISINPGYDSAEWFRNVVVRGNTITNLGLCSICMTSAPGVVVERNVIRRARDTQHLGIVIPDRSVGTGDDPDSGAAVRDNVVCLAVAHQHSRAVQVYAGATEVGTVYRIGADATTGVCAL
jgi:hypothetical protein